MLTDTRKNGYALSDADVTPGIAALGAPIFNHRHELEASLSISGLRDQILGYKLTGTPTDRCRSRGECVARRRVAVNAERPMGILARLAWSSCWPNAGR